MALVTLDDAKHHLRLSDADADNRDLDSKIEQASAIVITHLKAQAVDGWSDGSVAVPWNVVAAVFVVLTGLHEQQPPDWDTFERLLVGMRDPALA